MDNRTSTKMLRKEFTTDERREILDKSNGVCMCCNKKLTLETMTIDHLFPLYKGGDNSKINLVALCNRCNQEKGSYLYSCRYLISYVKREDRPEFIEYYMNKLNENRDKLGILGCDIKYYYYMPDSVKYIFLQSAKRKRNREKLLKLLRNGVGRITLSKAFTAEAVEIAEYINRELKDTDNGKLYDNEYKVLQAIKFGEVYVVRNGNTLCGVFIFKRILHDKRIEFVQLDALEMNSRLKQKYIITMAHVSRYIDAAAYNDIMSNILEDMLKSGIAPLYFGIISSYFDGDMKDKLIKLPYELEGIQSEVAFVPLKYERKMHMGFLQYLVDDGVMTEDELAEYVDTMIGDGTDESDEEAYADIVAYNKKIVTFYVNDTRPCDITFDIV